MSGDVLTVWTVYRSPKDFPGKWVLRAHDCLRDGTARARADAVVTGSLETIRLALPPGLVCLGRQPGDDAAIYESWI